MLSENVDTTYLNWAKFFRESMCSDNRCSGQDTSHKKKVDHRVTATEANA